MNFFNKTSRLFALLVASSFFAGSAIAGGGCGGGGSKPEKVAKYKIPKEVIFVNNIPKNALGKIEIDKVKQLVN